MPVTSTMLMARRKRKSLTSQKGTKRSRTTYASPVVFRPQNAGGRRSALGQMKIVKLNWATRGVIPPQTVAATACAAEYSITSPFKPDTILINNRQPMGWDQLVPLFDRYHVTGVKYKVAVLGTSNESRVVGVAITDRQIAALTNFNLETLVEQGLVQWKPLSPGTAGPNVTMFEGYVDCPKVVGKTYNEYVADSELGAITSTSPANPIYLYVYAGNSLATVTALGATDIFVELEMTIRFHGSNITPSS